MALESDKLLESRDLWIMVLRSSRTGRLVAFVPAQVAHFPESIKPDNPVISA